MIHTTYVTAWAIPFNYEFDITFMLETQPSINVQGLTRSQMLAVLQAHGHPLERLLYVLDEAVEHPTHMTEV